MKNWVFIDLYNMLCLFVFSIWSVKTKYISNKHIMKHYDIYIYYTIVQYLLNQHMNE